MRQGNVKQRRRQADGNRGCEGFLKENAERKGSNTMFLQQNNRRILEELQLWPSSRPDKD